RRAAPGEWRTVFAHVGLAFLLAIGVYVVTNPFVIIHLLGDRTILVSNLGNSQAMYRTPIRWDTIGTVADLVAEGASPLIAAVGVLAILFDPRRKTALGRMLLLLSLPIFAQFVSLATGKPGEYARFAVFPDIVLAIFAIVGMAKLFENRPR